MDAIVAGMTTFSEYGFLSDESAEAMRTDIRAVAAEEFERVRQLVRTAMSDLAECDASPSSAAGAAAFGYWVRTLEACQGTFLLAERGMETSALALLRTAYECLFFACALWRNPEAVSRLEAEHHVQRLRQARQMRATGEGRLTEDRMLELDAILTEQSPSGGYSAWDAASDAGLIFEYESCYRGLGLVGAHASLRSLDATFQWNEDGSLDFEIGPASDRVAWIVGLVRGCLGFGILRFREAFPPVDA